MGKGAVRMKRVTGIGGIFFKSDDPQKLYGWYEQHLGIKREPHGQGAEFSWRGKEDPAEEGTTVWSVFPRGTKYFNPSPSSFMINYRVDNLGALLEELKKEGVEIDRQEDSDFGRFAWIMDPDGNRVELWEPPTAK
jgi:catechol 2,3-dioxygenase-like lactoylglutathione lyase family enzyme